MRFTAAAVVLCAALAHGGELRQQASLELELDPNGVQQAVLAVPKFPAGLGRLRGVHFRVVVDSRNTLGIENTLSLPAVVDRTFGQAFVVSLPDGTELALAQLQSQSLSLLGAYDGQLDYGGASGRSESLNALETRETVLAPRPLFVGATSDDVLSLQVDAFSALDLGGTGKLQSSLRSHATVTVEVVYRY